MEEWGHDIAIQAMYIRGVFGAGKDSEVRSVLLQRMDDPRERLG